MGGAKQGGRGTRGRARVLRTADEPEPARRPNSEALLADRLLQHLCGEEFFVEGGPDLPTYSHILDCGRVESQIDHVLCDEGVAPALGEGQVLPGLSDNDHKWLEVSLLRRVDAHAGPARHTKPPLWKLTAEQWAEFERDSHELVSNALAALAEDATPAQRLRAIEQALEAKVAPWLQKKDAPARRERAPGSGHRTADERLRSDVGRWEALSRVVEQRDATHACFGPAVSFSRRAFAKVKQFTAIVAADLSQVQRREAMRRVCARELKAARKAYASLQTKEGDGFVEAFEEAIDEGGEGGSYVRLFEILKMATGKGKKIKWRGQKQEGKTRFQGRKVSPVRLSSLYKGGDKAKGVVTGAKAVLEEVHAQAAATNGNKQSFPEVTGQLMTQLRAQ